MLCRSFAGYAVGREQTYGRSRRSLRMTVRKNPPLLEDLRNHTPAQMAELRLLLHSGAPSRPDPRRPGFFEVQCDSNVFYVFKYPCGTKVLLFGVCDRARDRVAAIAACSCSPSAYL